MSKQRLLSSTLAKRILENTDCTFDANTLNTCCGFNEIGNFEDMDSLECIYKNHNKMFDNCHLDDWGVFLAEYNPERIETEFIKALSSDLQDKLKSKNKGYPYIVAFHQKEQRLIIEAFKLLPDLQCIENVVSGSTKNLLTIFIYAPVKV